MWMQGPPPTMRQTFIIVLIGGIVVQLFPLRSLSPNRRVYWKNRLKGAVIAIVGGVVYYVLPRL